MRWARAWPCASGAYASGAVNMEASCALAAPAPAGWPWWAACTCRGRGLGDSAATN